MSDQYENSGTEKSCMAILFCKLGNVQNIMIESMRNSELVVAASQNSIRLRMAVQPA